MVRRAVVSMVITSTMSGGARPTSNGSRSADRSGANSVRLGLSDQLAGVASLRRRFLSSGVPGATAVSSVGSAAASASAAS